MSEHPYQVMPELSDEEYGQLKADIAEHGVLVPIEFDEHGNTLDGHNRRRACLELGIENFPTLIRYGLSEKEKRLHAWKLNLVRRHLSSDSRVEIMRKMRAEGYTLQAIADAVNVSVDTAHRATKDSFPISENSPEITGTVIGADGKRYPTTKPRKTLFAETAAQITKATEPELAGRIASGAVKASNKLNLGGAHVGSNSGENEWYTPELYIEAARQAMGHIALDPASCKAANKIVKAAKFFDEKKNGLEQEWWGNVWLNPPYAQPLIGKFAEKLAASVEAGEIVQACVLVNNATETKWFQRIATVASAICFPAGRVKFWHPERESAPLQGQAVLYCGSDQSLFVEKFSSFGFVARISK